MRIALLLFAALYSVHAQVTYDRLVHAVETNRRTGSPIGATTPPSATATLDQINTRT